MHALLAMETTPTDVTDSFPRSKLHINVFVYWCKFEVDRIFSAVSVRILKVSDDWSFILLPVSCVFRACSSLSQNRLHGFYGCDPSLTAILLAIIQDSAN